MDYLSRLNYSIYLQVLTLVGLAIGYLILKKKKVVQHSYLMFVLYLVHVLSIPVFMTSTARNILTQSLSTPLGYLTVLHIFLGVIVLAISTYVFVNWRFQKPSIKCYKMKKMMKLLTVLWIIVIFLGFYEYYLIYIQ